MSHFLLRPVHVSWRITALCVGIILGVVLAQFYKFDNFLLVVIILAPLLLGGFAVSYWPSMVGMLICGIFIGLLRGGVAMSPIKDFAAQYGLPASIIGNVVDDLDISREGKKRLKLDVHSINGVVTQGLVWAELVNQAEIRRSDIVNITGIIDEGFGNFSGMIMKAKVVTVKRPVPGDIPLTIRDWFASKIRLSIKEPQASLGIGYLVGQKSALPNELYDALQISGLTHIVVASGYNLTILVRFARRLLMPVSKFTSTMSALAMIIGFVAITGLSPSMSRAALVSTLSLAAWYYGRKFHPITLIVFVASITVLISPNYAWGDVGWLLSFTSFVGVIMLAPLLHRYFFGDKKPGVIRQVLGETISAQLVTLPIILVTFGALSTVSLVANVLILPFIPLAMVFTFVGGLSAIFTPQWATLVGEPANWLLGYMTNVALKLSEWEWAQIEIKIDGWWATYLVFMIGLLIIFLERRTRYDLRESNIIV